MKKRGENRSFFLAVCVSRKDGVEESWDESLRGTFSTIYYKLSRFYFKIFRRVFVFKGVKEKKSKKKRIVFLFLKKLRAGNQG